MLTLVERARVLADAHDRSDLNARLRNAAARLRAPDVTVAVVGEFKQGKSTLLNALLGTEICPTDDDIATAVPTVLRSGKSSAVAVAGAADGEGEESLELPLADVAAVAVSGRHGERSIRRLEVRIPAPVLESGIVLIDTPGAGGLDSAQAMATLVALQSAHAVIFVTDALQEFTSAELRFLDEVVDRCPFVLVVLSKIDLTHHWRYTEKLDRGHLTRRGLDLPIVPLSGTIGDLALPPEDDEDRFGTEAVRSWLADEVMPRKEDLAVRSAAGDTRVVVDELRQPLLAEREVLVDPGQEVALLEELSAAEERAATLHAAGSWWQRALADGVEDLVADVEYDLRQRLQRARVTIDTRFEETDPLASWDELDPWLRRVVAEQVAATYDGLRAEAGRLAERVADLFGEGAPAPLSFGGADRVLDQLEVADEVEERGRPERGASALAFVAGGMETLGVLAGLAGMTIAAPVSVGVGLVLGVKTVRAGRRERVEEGRRQAHDHAHRYLDEVRLTVAKDTRDVVRRLQRELRDVYVERAVEMQRSATTALEAARRAARTESEEVARRTADVEARLAELDELARSTTAVDTQGRSGAGAG
jgi:GTPase SAR1 family protein